MTIRYYFVKGLLAAALKIAVNVLAALSHTHIYTHFKIFPDHSWVKRSTRSGRKCQQIWRWQVYVRAPAQTTVSGIVANLVQESELWGYRRQEIEQIGINIIWW